jgi:hypothetical protein
MNGFKVHFMARKFFSSSACPHFIFFELGKCLPVNNVGRRKKRKRLVASPRMDMKGEALIS